MSFITEIVYLTVPILVADIIHTSVYGICLLKANNISYNLSELFSLFLMVKMRFAMQK